MLCVLFLTVLSLQTTPTVGKCRSLYTAKDNFKDPDQLWEKPVQDNTELTGTIVISGKYTESCYKAGVGSEEKEYLVFKVDNKELLTFRLGDDFFKVYYGNKRYGTVRHTRSSWEFEMKIKTTKDANVQVDAYVGEAVSGFETDFANALESLQTTEKIISEGHNCMRYNSIDLCPDENTDDADDTGGDADVIPVIKGPELADMGATITLTCIASYIGSIPKFAWGHETLNSTMTVPGGTYELKIANFAGVDVGSYWCIAGVIRSKPFLLYDQPVIISQPNFTVINSSEQTTFQWSLSWWALISGPTLFINGVNVSRNISTIAEREQIRNEPGFKVISFVSASGMFANFKEVSVELRCSEAQIWSHTYKSQKDNSSEETNSDDRPTPDDDTNPNENKTDNNTIVIKKCKLGTSCSYYITVASLVIFITFLILIKLYQLKLRHVRIRKAKHALKLIVQEGVECDIIYVNPIEEYGDAEGDPYDTIGEGIGDAEGDQYDTIGEEIGGNYNTLPVLNAVSIEKEGLYECIDNGTKEKNKNEESSSTYKTLQAAIGGVEDADTYVHLHHDAQQDEDDVYATVDKSYKEADGHAYDVGIIPPEGDNHVHDVKFPEINLRLYEDTPILDDATYDTLQGGSEDNTGRDKEEGMYARLNEGQIVLSMDATQVLSPRMYEDNALILAGNSTDDATYDTLKEESESVYDTIATGYIVEDGEEEMYAHLNEQQNVLNNLYEDNLLILANNSTGINDVYNTIQGGYEDVNNRIEDGDEGMYASLTRRLG